MFKFEPLWARYLKTILETFERKTRSSDFYTSMVAEAIRQSEIEAKKEQQKQNRKESKKGKNASLYE